MISTHPETLQLMINGNVVRADSVGHVYLVSAEELGRSELQDGHWYLIESAACWTSRARYRSDDDVFEFCDGSTCTCALEIRKIICVTGNGGL